MNGAECGDCDEIHCVCCKVCGYAVCKCEKAVPEAETHAEWLARKVKNERLIIMSRYDLAIRSVLCMIAGLLAGLLYSVYLSNFGLDTPETEEKTPMVESEEQVADDLVGPLRTRGGIRPDEVEALVRLAYRRGRAQQIVATREQLDSAEAASEAQRGRDDG